MKCYTFSIAVTYQQFLQHYSGAASSVLLMTDCGLKLQLPAVRLRPFLRQSGIHGRFKVTVNALNKFHTIEQIAS